MASLTISSYLTFTSKRLNQIPTITFTDGGIAGQEVVTVTGYSNISVSIQSGVTTMLQVKTAIETSTVTSGFSASDLVSVSITPTHNSDTVQTVVNAVLTGAITAPAANAYAIIGPVRYDAVAPGSVGNAISVSYTDGAVAGSEIVTVVGNAISVQVSDAESGLEKQDFVMHGGSHASSPQNMPVPGVDYTDAAQIIAAIRGSVAASALVTIEYWVVGTPAPVYADAAESPARFLTGGTDGAPATVTIEGLTITSITNAASQNGATLTLTTGATAGAEVVTMAGNNISVQIQNGVSTVTQVRTALNIAPAFTALYVASGTSATPMYTVNALPLV